MQGPSHRPRHAVSSASATYYYDCSDDDDWHGDDIGQAGALQVFGAMGDTYIHKTQPGHCTDACEPSTCPFPSGSGCRKPLSPNKPHLQGHLTG